MRLDLEYNTGMFGRPRVERLPGHLDRVIDGLVSSPDAKLEDLDILPRKSGGAYWGVLGRPRYACATPDATVSICSPRRRFATPARIAVVFEQRSLTYADLSDGLGPACRPHPARRNCAGSVVALVADRSEWMVAGVIGIMASGAACLPIDAAQPRERIMRILEDSGCQAVVSDGGGETPRSARVPLDPLFGRRIKRLPRAKSRPGGRLRTRASAPTARHRPSRKRGRRRRTTG